MMEVHVDDLALWGALEEIDYLFEALSKKIKLKRVARLCDAGDQGEYLGRVLTMTEDGYIWRGSDRLRENFVQSQRAEQSKWVGTPCINYTEAQLRDQMELNSNETREFRSGLGLLLFLAQDRPELQYASLVASQAGGRPTNVDQ